MLVYLSIFQLNDPNPEDPLNWKAAELYKTNNLMLVYLNIFQLNDPNPEDPLNSKAAELYKTDRRSYEKIVRELAAQTWQD